MYKKYGEISMHRIPEESPSGTSVASHFMRNMVKYCWTLLYHHNNNKLLSIIIIIIKIIIIIIIMIIIIIWVIYCEYFYGLPVVGILEKNDRVIKGQCCIPYGCASRSCVGQTEPTWTISYKVLITKCCTAHRVVLRCAELPDVWEKQVCPSATKCYKCRYETLLSGELFYIAVTSYFALKSPASRLFAQLFVEAQIKENFKAPRHWPLWEESTGDRWIPLTKGQ